MTWRHAPKFPLGRISGNHGNQSLVNSAADQHCGRMGQSLHNIPSIRQQNALHTDSGLALSRLIELQIASSWLGLSFGWESFGFSGPAHNGSAELR